MSDITFAKLQIILPALCWSARRRDFYAVTTGVSAAGLCFRSSYSLTVDEPITCEIQHIGAVDARVVQVGDQSFTVSPHGGRDPLVELAGRIIKLSRAQNLASGPLRNDRRIVIVRDRVVVTLENGNSLIGRVRDISTSGVALLIDRPIVLGTTIRVGAKSAKVVRFIENGIGAAFLEPFEESAVHSAMTL